MKWTEQEDQILIKNFGKLPVSEIRKLLPTIRSRRAVNGRAKRLGLESNKILICRQAATKYSHNPSFFSVPNVVNSYWAGFIAADGNVSNKRSRLAINLSWRDRSHLELLKRDLQWDGPLGECYGFRHGKKNKCASLIMYGAKQIIADLDQNFGIVPAKTLILEPPPIKDKFLKVAFIKGYFDGDGFRTTCKTKYGIYPVVGWLGTELMMQWIKNVLLPDGKANPCRHVNVWQLRFCGKPASHIIREMESVETPVLARKWATD